MEWVCERLGEAMPDPAGGFRRHSALYDAEQTARLYRKLVRMLAAGEKIYAHLPAGAPPAAALGRRAHLPRLPNAERSQGRGAQAGGVLGRDPLSVLRARGRGSGGV